MIMQLYSRLTRLASIAVLALVAFTTQIYASVTVVTIPVTVSAGGAFTVEINVSGFLHQIRYVPDGTNPLDTGADVTLVGKTTGFSYLNLANIGTSAFQKLPRYATTDEQGVASLYAAAGEPVEDRMWAGPEILTFTIAQGGTSKLGTFYLWFETSR